MDNKSIAIDLRKESSQVRQWADDHGLTVSAVFEGLWAILLSCHSGFESASFRISREHPDGMLVENCHAEVYQNLPFIDFIRSLHKTTTAEPLPQSKGLSPRSLQDTQIWFCLGPIDSSHIDQAGTPLNVVVEHGLSGLFANLRYSAKVWREDEAQNLVDSFKLGLNQVLQNATIPIDDIDFVSEHQYNQLMKWNSPYPGNHFRSVHELISIRAASQPLAEAICSTETNLTYQKLEELSSGFAQTLAEAGVGPEVVVPVCSHKSPWAVVAMLAILKAGGAYTIIPPGSPDERVQHILEVVDAKLVLATPDTVTMFPSIRTFVFSADFFNSLSVAPLISNIGCVESSNAFCVIFTSGCAGQTRGITVEHRNHVTSSRATMKRLGWTPQTRIFQYSAFNWDVSTRDIFGGLMAGACICMPTDSERMETLAATITRMKADFIATTPTVIRLLSPGDVPTIKTMSSIGEKLTDDLANFWSERLHLINDYGSAEVTVSSCMRSVDSAQHSSANIGTRLPSCLTWVTNPRNPDMLVPIGAVGELIVQGPTVTRGYRKDRQNTFAAYTQNLAWQRKLGYPEEQQRVYRTGDMVRLNLDGSLDYIGRRDTQIKINGQWVEMSEIENQLNAAKFSPRQISVSMISSPDRPEKQVLAAFLDLSQAASTAGNFSSGVLPPSAEVTKLASSIRTAIEDKLPAFMIPSHYIPVAYTPRMDSGKTDRSILQHWACQLSWKKLSAYACLTSASVQVLSVVEQSLQQLWASILNIDDADSIKANDHFIQLGGDPTAAIRLSRAAREQGIVLSSKSILDNPVLSKMALAIDSKRVDSGYVEAPRPFAMVDTSFVNPANLARIAEELQVQVESIKDAYPCTSLQEDLIASTMMDSAAYISQQIFRLPDDLDLDRFEAAWDHVHALTPILRTRILSDVIAGQPRLIQVVIDEKIFWQFGADLQAYLNKDKMLGMTVGQQLCRFALLRTEAAQYFVWTAHQAIYDSWSLELLLDDVSALYHGTAPVSRPSVSTFVRYLESQEPVMCQRFWKSYLRGCETSDFLQLPPGKSSALATSTVNHTIKSMPANTAQVTSSAIFRVAWAMVLGQYTGSRDIVFGCTQMGRTIDGVDADQLVAPMFATVPVRIKYNKTQSVRSLLTDTQNAANEMLPYEHVGLQKLRQYDDACRKGSEFQSIVIIQAPASKQPFPFHDQQHLDGDDLLTYPLGIECLPQQGQLRIEAHFDPQVIEEGTVLRMLLQLESIIAQIAVAGDSTVGDLDMLCAQDKQCLKDFNDNGAQSIDACVHQVIRQRTFLAPDAIALKDDLTELSYQQLDNTSRRLASHLALLGIGPEVLVPLCFEKSVWSAVSMLAVLRAGGACVALDPALPDARLAEVLKRTGAQQILVSPAQEHRFNSTNFNVTVIGDQNSIARLPMDSFSTRVPVRPDNAAFVVFTSGSTGKPKGIVLEHRNVCSTAQTMHNVQFLNSSSRVLQFASYTFDVYIEEIFITLMWGGCVCIPSDDQRRNDLAGFINRMQVNWMDVTPTLMGTLHPDEVPSLKTVVCGGEKLTPEVVERWAEKVNVVFTYGPAECSIICTSLKVPMARDADLTNVGHSMGGSVWIVHQEDHNQLVPVGGVGEILVEGPIVAREYLNDAVATSRSFISNPAWAAQEGKTRRFYKTGDLARHNEDGSICIIGRADSQIKIHGQRIELGDIEHAITRLITEGSRVVVEAIPESAEVGQKQLAAFITYPSSSTKQHQQGLCLDFTEDLRISLTEIQNKLTTLIPQHMIPQLFVPVARHPQTTSGKTDRKALREIGQAFTKQERLQFSLVTEKKRVSTSDQERVLKSLWSTVLNLDESSIGADDKFFQLGGNSISAMRLASAARGKGLIIAVRDVFEYPKLCELAKRISTVDGKDFEKPATLSTSSSKPVSPMVSPVAASPVSPLPVSRALVSRSSFSRSSVGESSVSQYSVSRSSTSPSSVSTAPLMTEDRFQRVMEEVQNQLDCDASHIEDIYPCTPLQQNLMASTVRDHSSYVIREVFQLSSRIDITRFREAWNTVCSKHAILRTRILPVSTSAESIEMYQVVLRETAYWTEATDLNNFMEEDRSLGMDYGKRLCRFAIITKDKKPAHFVLTAHHATYDGWSLSLIYREVSDIYNGRDTTPSLPFKAFVKFVKDIDQEQSATFWKKQLLGCVPTQFPPITKLEHEVSATETIVHHFEHQYDPRYDLDVTITTVLHAAWAMLLSTYTDSQDIVFGSINASRDAALEGIETVIGPTIATVPLRIKINKEENIRQFLKRLQTQRWDVAEHQHFGLDRIARVSGEARKAIQFQNLLVVQPDEDVKSNELLDLPKVDADLEGYMSFPLTVQCSLGATVVSTTANYDPSFLNVPDVDRILEQFAHITQQLVQAGEGTTIEDIDLLSQEDLSQLRAWNNYEPETVERSIPDLISNFANVQPNAEAVHGWDGSLTYSELDDLSTRFARFLRKSFHVKTYEKIPFCTDKSVWTVVAMLAILKAGGSTIALDPSFPVERIAAILGATEARFIITQSKYERKFELMQRNILVIDEAMIKKLPIARRSDLPHVPPTAPASVLFSSGTTGIPKGIILEHQAIATAAREHGRFSGVQPGTRVLQFAAYTFDVSIQDVFMTLSNGGCICVPSEAQRLDDMASAINAMQVNWTFLTPTVAKLLEPASVPNLKTLVLGGEAMLPEHLAIWSQAVTLFNGYGPAEAGTVCAIRKINDTIGYEPSNVGRSLKSIRCWVTNADNPHQLLPIGAIGELLVEGPSLALSYLNDPEKTTAAFIEPPLWAKTHKIISTHKWRFYRTGDLVRQLPDGSFTYLGRKDTQVKLHGQRLELDEIEYQIKTAFDSDCQVVVDVVKPEHRAGSDLLTAFICLSNKRSSDPQKSLIAEVSDAYVEMAKMAKAAVGKHLPVYAIPALWIPVTHMPTSLSQKLDRKVLKAAASVLSAEDLALCSFSNTEKRPPVTDLETSLASLWAKLLNLSINFIGLDDSFFEIGGDSITAMKLVALARKNKIFLSMTTIFRHPRLAEMAAAVGNSDTQLSLKSRSPDVQPFSLMTLSQEDLSTYLDGVATDYNIGRFDIVDAYPCTPMQEGLFALTMSDASLYMAQFAFEIGSDINIEFFINAWNEVVRLLPVLRTTIVPAPPVLQSRCHSCQIVLDDPSPWQRYFGNEVQQYLQAEMPKNIGYGSNLVKFAIIEGQKRYFAATMHHAFYDGWSLSKIFSLVEQVYFESPRPTIVPYNHFVWSQMDVAQNELSDFWTEYLSGYTSTAFPKLPNSKYVPSIDGQQEKRIALKGSKVTGVMPATLIQTAWAMVLGAHASTDDIVFLSTQIGRSSDLEGIEEIIGCTITTVPVRFVVDRGEKLGDFLRRVQDRSNDMTKFEHYGLRNIQKLGSEQRAACQAGCLMVIQPHQEKTDSKLGLIPLSSDDTQMLSYPLVIECNLGQGFVNARFGFDTNLLPKETMGRIIDEFASVLQALSSMNEDVPVADVEILCPAELSLLKEWNTTPPKYEHETVQDSFRRAVKRWPQRVAVDGWDACFSYTDLDRLSTNLAQYLLSLGLKRQQVVPMVFEKSAWTVVSMLAVAKAGCTFVTFDPSVPKERVLDICQEVNTQVILASREQSQNWTEHYKVFAVDATALSALPDANPNLKVPSDPTDLLYLIYTSGSTGKPKGCMTQHGSFLSVLQGQRDASDFGISDRMLQFASYSFDISLLEIFSSLMLGSRLCVPSQHACSTNIADVLRSWKITWSYLTPSLTRTIDPSSVPHLRALALVGEQVMPIDVAKWADHLSLINGYGPSESVAATSNIGVKADGEPSNIGLPMGCVCWIVDPEDHDRLVPIGTVGELVIDGPIVSPGYFQNPEKTAQSFVNSTKFLEKITGRKETRMYKTGDLAKQNLDRTITFVGRKDTQVKIRGQRMELGEPEHHLSEDSLVHSAVVLKGQKGGPLENQLVAILSLRDPRSSTQRKGAIQYLAASEELSGYTTHLTALLEKKMPLYMVPTTWIYLEKMPLLPAGKVDRKRLQNWIHEIDDDDLQQCVGSTGNSEDEQNLSSELINLRNAIGQALNMPPEKVKLNRSFLAQGGDSISAMQVHGRLRKLRLDIDFKDIVVANSLIELAETIKPLDNVDEAIVFPSEQELQPFALAPMQSWYAKYALGEDPLSRSTNINFNYTFNFAFKVPISFDAIRNAFEAVIQRNSMLRARFFIDETGEWKQVITKDVQGSYRLQLKKASSQSERDAILEGSRTSLDIKNGPLLRADVIMMRDGQKSLHVVLHHLVTDRVSWSLLLAELTKHITTGNLPEQPPFSYQVWSDLQAKNAIQDWPPHTALPYEVPNADLDFWGMSDMPNTVQQMVTHNVKLPADLVSLVRSNAKSDDVEVSDMLTVALSSSFKQNFPEREPPTIFNQGHGREPHHPDIDLSETIGWFTTYWPIQISPRPEETPITSLQRTKVLRQSLPYNGRAYFASKTHHPEGIKAFSDHDNMEIYLNYLGDFRKHSDDNSLLEMIGSLDSGLHGQEDVKRLALFTVTAMTEEDGFRVAFAYNKNSKHVDRIENWVRDFEVQLHELTGVSRERAIELTEAARQQAFEHASDARRASMLAIQDSRLPALIPIPMAAIRAKMLLSSLGYRSSSVLKSMRFGRSAMVV